MNRNELLVLHRVGECRIHSSLAMQVIGRLREDLNAGLVLGKPSSAGIQEGAR